MGLVHNAIDEALRSLKSLISGRELRPQARQVLRRDQGTVESGVIMHVQDAACTCCQTRLDEGIVA